MVSQFLPGTATTTSGIMSEEELERQRLRALMEGATEAQTLTYKEASLLYPELFSDLGDSLENPETFEYKFDPNDSSVSLVAPEGLQLADTGVPQTHDEELYLRIAESSEPQELTVGELKALGIDLSDEIPDWQDWTGGTIELNQYTGKINLLGLTNPLGEQKTIEELEYDFSGAGQRQVVNDAWLAIQSLEEPSTVGIGTGEGLPKYMTNTNEVRDILLGTGLFTEEELTNVDEIEEAYNQLEILHNIPPAPVLDDAFSTIFKGTKLADMLPEEAMQELATMMQNDPEGTIDKIVGDGWTPEGEFIFRAMGYDTETIDNIFQWRQATADTIPYVLRAFKTDNPEAILKWIISNPEAYVHQMQGLGWTQDRENLLRIMVPGISDTKVREVFYGKYDKGFWGKAWDQWTAGSLDFSASIAGGVQWAGQKLGLGGVERWGEALNYVTEGTRQYAGLQLPVAEGLGWDFVRMLPAQVVLIGVSMPVGGALGAAGSKALGLGKFSTYVLQTAGMAAVSRPLESLMEAGGLYNQLLSEGWTKEDASKSATETFNRNMELIGLDFMQFAEVMAPFAKLGNVAPKLLQRGLIKYLGKGLGIAGVALSEGGEEYYQQIIQMQAMGEDISAWAVMNNLSNEEIQQVTILGMMSGGLFAGGGDVVATIQDITLNNLAADTAMKVRQDIAEQIRNGVDPTIAKNIALSRVIHEPEVQEVVDKVMKIVNAYNYENLIETDDPARAEQLTQKLQADVSSTGYDVILPKIEPNTQTRMDLEITTPKATPLGELKTAEQVRQRVLELSSEITEEESYGVSAFVKGQAAYLGLTEETFIEQYLSDVTAGEEDITFRKIAREAEAEGDRLKGAIGFKISDGKAVIGIFKHTNISDAMHEFAHLGRKILKPEDLTVIEEWTGVENSKWNTAAEEQWAAGFETYLMTGQSPNSKIAEIFFKLKKAILAIYKEFLSPDMPVVIPQEVRSVYDKLLTESGVSAEIPTSTITEEAVQPDMFGGETRVAPTSKGKPTQMSMEDYMKYKQAMGETLSKKVPKEFNINSLSDEERMLAKGLQAIDQKSRNAFLGSMNALIEDLQEEIGFWSSEIDAHNEFLKSDPLANYKGKYTTKKGEVKNIKLPSILKNGDLPETLTPRQAEALMMGRTIKKSALDKQGNVRTAYIIDEIAENFGLTEQEFVDHLRAIKEQSAYIRDIKGNLAVNEEELAQANRNKQIVDYIDANPTVDIPGVTEVKTEVVFERTEVPVETKETQAIFTEEGFPKTIEMMEAEGYSFEPIQEETTPAELKPTEPIKALETAAVREARMRPMRQAIMSWVKFKGISESQYKGLVRKALGTKQAKGLRAMTEEELGKVRQAVRKARPEKIRGRAVITTKTENKIQSLKDVLIKEKRMTEKEFVRIAQSLGLSTVKYSSVHSYITESEGKSLIRAMNDRADWIGHTIENEENLANNPHIRAKYNENKRRTGKGLTAMGEPIEIKRGSELRSMRYFMQVLNRATGLPLYQQWQQINMANLAKRQYEQHLIDRLEKASLGQFKSITQSEESLKRIEDYIASKHNMSGAKEPLDITESEKRFAEELEKQLFQFRNDVRYARFMNSYIENDGNIDRMIEDIPSANKKALRRAMDLYESRGSTALRTFLDTQEWGIIHSGYNPLSIIKPSIFKAQTRMTSFGKGHIKTRTGTEFTQDDRNIMDRYRGYMRQLYGLTVMQPMIRNFAATFDEAIPMIANAGHVANVMSKNFNVMKGYRDTDDWWYWGARKLYSQFAAATFWQPYMALRNLFQNPALNPDTIYTIDPRNKKLTNEQRLWFEIFVAQDSGLTQDYLLRGTKPLDLNDALEIARKAGINVSTNLAPMDLVVRMANRTSLFPLSDKINRIWAFWLRHNRAERAVAQYRKDGNIDNLLRNSGAEGLTQEQQNEAMEFLMREEVDYGVQGLRAFTGEEAFALYVAQQHTSDVQFLYDRSQRAPVEQSPLGEILGNILVFSRSWTERSFLNIAKALDSKATMTERITGATNVVYMIVFGMLAGWLLGKITGRDKYNPYNPLNIMSWVPGGLIVGASTDLFNLVGTILNATMGDKSAISRLPTEITRVGDLSIPFYKATMQLIESGLGMENIDRYAIRKLREILDDNYNVAEDAYRVERNLVEWIQHAIFNAPTKAETTDDKVKEVVDLLGEVRDIEDLLWSSEDPDLYDLPWLNSEFLNLFGNDNLDGVISSDVPDIVKDWANMWKIYDEYRDIPNRKLYEVENIYTDTTISKRDRELIEQYNSLSGDEQEAFLEKHPELKVNPAEQWLKDNPKENATLYLWGKTSKLLTEQAYNELRTMAVALDVPDSVLPDIPSEEIVGDYFAYQELTDQYASGSAEALLFLLEHDEFREWAGYKKPDNNIEVLRYDVKYRDKDAEYAALESNEDRAAFWADPENETYHQDCFKRDWYRMESKTLEYYDDDIPEGLMGSYLEYRNTSFKFGGSSSEVKLMRLNNPDLDEWGKNTDIHGSNAWSVIDSGNMSVDTYRKYLEINVKYREEDTAWINMAVKAQTTTELANQRAAFLIENPGYAKARRYREAYLLAIPDEWVDTFVEYKEYGHSKGSNLGNKWLWNHRDFFDAIREIMGWGPLDMPRGGQYGYSTSAFGLPGGARIVGPGYR